MMKNRQIRTFSIVLIVTVCFRLVLLENSNLWHGETLWLMRPLADPSGSPLFSLLARFWSAISRHDIWLRTLPFVFSVAAVVMICRLSMRTFDGIGSTEATSLAVVSPLLCTAAWEFHPCSLEIFVAALWLFAFLKAIDGEHTQDWIVHGGAAMVALCANPLMALLLPGQALVLAVFRRSETRIVVRWLITIGPAIGLVLILFLIQSGADDVDVDHAAPESALGCYDMGYLFTDISLGRLNAWKPLPPAFTFAKPGFEDARIAGRQVGSEGGGDIFSFLQVTQFLLTTWFFFALVLACLSIWRFRTWILPSHLRSRALLRKVQEPGHETALLLLCSIFIPPLYYLCAGTPLDSPFPEQRLFFVMAPFVILVGRGLTRFQWVVIRYGFVLIVAALSFLYSFHSVSFRQTFDGIAPAVDRIVEDWADDDGVVAAPFVLGPIGWYSGGLTLGEPGGVGQTGRLWSVSFTPAVGGIEEDAGAFVGRAFGGDGRVESDLAEPESAQKTEIGNYTILRSER